MSLTAVYNHPESGYGPAKGLAVGKAYSVRELHMGQSFTNIWLEGFAFSFNSVQFDFYEDGKLIDIYRSPKYNPYMKRRTQ